MRRRLFLSALTATVALGLALRLWSAQGGLWVDEAWSAVLVERARTPWGVLVAINHDNNHHLNSLWMQLCGFGASPFALRALSIVSGTLTILIAAAIGARQSKAHAMVAALLFAISPIQVNYGSEARGYAPMLLAAMAMIWRVSRELGEPDRGKGSAWLLGGLALVGLFSQLTMVFFIIAITGWVAWSLSRKMALDAAFAATVRLLLPSFGACVIAFGTTIGAAVLSSTGMQAGSYVPFSFESWSGALPTVASATLGLSDSAGWAVALIMILIAALAVRAGRRSTPLGAFQLIAILGFPLLFPLLQIGNSSMARYYLVAAVAILLLAADVFAEAFAKRRARIGSAIIMAALATACVREDLAQAALRRGDPGAAIEAMKYRAPAGATVMIDFPSAFSTLRVAAASARYPLEIVEQCPARRFLHVDGSRGTSFALTTVRCGQIYQRLIVRRATRLSGVDWALYEQDISSAHPSTQTPSRAAIR